MVSYDRDILNSIFVSCVGAYIALFLVVSNNYCRLRGIIYKVLLGEVFYFITFLLSYFRDPDLRHARSRFVVCARMVETTLLPKDVSINKQLQNNLDLRTGRVKSCSVLNVFG